MPLWQLVLWAIGVTLFSEFVLDPIVHRVMLAFWPRYRWICGSEDLIERWAEDVPDPWAEGPKA